MTTFELKSEPLSRAAFAPFGDVIAAAGADHYPINEGTTERFHDLANLDVSAEGGRALVSLFRAQPRTLPLRVTMMECHPLSSQAFIPLGGKPFLVLVAPAGDAPAPEALKLFRSDGQQGINYARGVWHHPLLALDIESEFIIIDRGGPGEDCIEQAFAAEREILIVG